MDARDLKDLIQDVVHNPKFNSAEVDHNMLEKLMRAVEDEQMDILDLNSSNEYKNANWDSIFGGRANLVVSNLHGIRYHRIRTKIS